MANGSINELDKISRDLFDTYCSTCKDFFKETFTDSGLVEPLRRIILIGRLKYADSAKVRNLQDEMVKGIEESIVDESSKLSGLMIIDKTFFYHIAEGCDEAINDVILSTAKFVSMKLLYGAKVIRTSSIAFRYFQNWHSCVLLLSDFVDPPLKVPAVTKESDVATVAHMIKNLENVIFVLASYVHYLKSTEVEEKLNDLVPTSVLPFETELETIYNEPFFLTVERYIERYLTVQEYVSYLEQEWPPTGPIHDIKGYVDELEEFEKQIDESLQIEENQKKKKTRYGSWWWAQ